MWPGMWTRWPALGNERPQPLGGLDAQLRPLLLDGVDPEVERERVVGLGAERAFERRQHLLSLGLGRAVLLPVVPRHRVHQGLGEQGLDRRVVGERGRRPRAWRRRRLGRGRCGRLEGRVRSGPRAPRRAGGRPRASRSDPDRARWSAAQAGAASSAFMGALTWGPRASASPQAHIAHDGSSRCASRKARTASAWLKANESTSPWSENRCARGTSVSTAREKSPRPSRRGASGASCARAETAASRTSERRKARMGTTAGG